MTQVAVTGLAIARDTKCAVMELQQGRDARIYDESDVSTATAIATVRAGEGLEFFATN